MLLCPSGAQASISLMADWAAVKLFIAIVVGFAVVLNCTPICLFCLVYHRFMAVSTTFLNFWINLGWVFRLAYGKRHWFSLD